MFLLGATLSSGHPTSALAWPAAILKVPRAKFTPSFLHWPASGYYEGFARDANTLLY